MSKDDLVKRISELESLNDQLASELRYLDDLMRQLGFDDGLKTLKAAAEEMLQNNDER
jgi:hypothetical protein